MSVSITSLQDVSFEQILAMSQSKGAQALMLEVQAMLTKEFDEQMRDKAEKLEFLHELKKKYHDNINKINQFMSQDHNLSRKDGKVYYEATFREMGDLFNVLTTYDYDLNTKELTPKPLKFNDGGDKHKLDEMGYVDASDGYTDTAEWAAYFMKGTQIHDKDEAMAHARLTSDDNTDMPFYMGHIWNTDASGMPKFSMFSDKLDKMLEQIQNALSDVEMETEELSTNLEELGKQRQAALQGLQDLMRKIASAHEYALEKGGD